jgi:hypothetical protein
VNLPADLPDNFGAQFNAARFASSSETSETYPDVVLDPPSDPNYIQKVLANSALVGAEPVPFVPLGWVAQSVPFHQPREQFLTGGRANRPAQIYLQDPKGSGIVRIFAAKNGKPENGPWGNDIALSVRFAGPAIFYLTIGYTAARFECARAIAFAGRVLRPGEDPLPALIAQILTPGPVGVVQAKAAGISAAVTREQT